MCPGDFSASASRALGMKRQIDTLFEIVRVLREKAPDLELQVIAFDQGVREVYRGYAGQFGEAQRDAIEARGALGASNFEKVLRHLAKTSVHPRVLLISDGEVTAGEGELPKLGALLQPLKDSGLQRIDAVIVGGIHDRAVLSALVKGGRNDGLVIDGNTDTQVVAHKLSWGTRSNVQVEVSNASWVWPQKLDGVQAGDPFIVYAAGNWNKLRVSVTGATLGSPLELE